MLLFLAVIVLAGEVFVFHKSPHKKEDDVYLEILYLGLYYSSSNSRRIINSSNY